MKSIANHLYIHIPFCQSICSYCDFKRYLFNNEKAKKYIIYLTKQVKLKCKNKKFKSIYIGGGTPNALPNELLISLLKLFKNNLDNKTEFTIECNPEFINDEQVKIFKNNKINRVSLGVQFWDDKLLKQFNRKHNKAKVIDAINLLRKNSFNNISCDFIYGIKDLTIDKIKQTINFINSYKIPHISFYSLELKSNSSLNLQNYKIDELEIEKQLSLIINLLKNKYQRYEVSNWTINKKYESIHNKAYWLTDDWIGIGLGASGFENRSYYTYKGNLEKITIEKSKLSLNDYYFQILMMGLRMSKGIELKKAKYANAYKYFKNRLKDVKIKNNFLFAKNINLLNNILLELI